MPTRYIKASRVYREAFFSKLYTLTLSTKSGEGQLEQILSWRQERKASRGSSISYLGHTYQLVDTRGAVVPLRPGATVEVLTHLDGSLSALYGGNRYLLRQLTQSPKVMAEEPKKAPASRAHKPAPNHPWRRMPINPAKKAMPLPNDNLLPASHTG